MTSAHERRNRDFWNADADDYQAVHAEQLARGAVWGAWAIPESELAVLGDTTALDVLELGCGAAEWSIALAASARSVIGLDQSRSQLRHAQANIARDGTPLPLVCASGEVTPFRSHSFDLVVCDHGAMSFCDPDRSVPEVSRLLRSGGLLVFNKATILHSLCYDRTKDRQTRRLHAPYFGSRVFDTGEGTVDFHVPYGEWISIFRAHDLEVESLIELRPPEGASTTYADFVPYEWARKWPAEEIWKVRKL